MSAGPVLVPCPPVALGERSPVPGWGTIPACPLSNLSVFPQVTEQQPQGQWAQEHIRYPACRGQLCAAWPCVAATASTNQSQRRHCSISSRRNYEHEAVRKRFTRARDDSDEDEGYEWGPATDV